MAKTVKGFYKEIRKELLETTIGVNSDYNKFLRIIVLRSWDLIIKRTPVDTGRARASWRITIGPNPVENVAEQVLTSSEIYAHRRDSTQGQPHSKFQAVIADVTNQGNREVGRINMARHRQIWISNNLPYIIYLEGEVPPDYTGQPISIQAPRGMIRISLDEVLSWAQTQPIVRRVER